MTVSACTFVGNDAFNGGGLFASGPATIRDSLFNGNSADNLGGGVYVNTSGDVSMVNVTVAHNTASTAGLWNAGTATVVNCVLWANAGSALGGGPTVTYSLVEGGFAGTGNVDADPQFVDPAGADTMIGTDDDDLRLSAGSPAIDAGDASAVTGQYPVDLDGNPRALDDPDTADTGLAVLGISVDMGAYEFQPGPPPPSCPGDIDGDNMVGVTDFLQLLAHFGACP
jgi:predicted outer membrane repeat protein